MYPYRKGRTGYARLQQRILAEEKSDATSLPEHVLWKAARVGKDGVVVEAVQNVYDECETLSQTLPSTEVQDCRSLLSRVLNVPEYSGRVRGKGFGVTPSSFYKKPKTKNPTNKEVMKTLAELRAQVLELQKENTKYREERRGSEAKDTSDRASINCQPKFPEGITPCQLYLSSPTYCIVGKGKVHNTSALHCPICLKCKPIKKLGQTGQEISQSSKQAQFSRSQGPRVGPTCSHDLGIHLKCFGQGLDVQKSSVNAQSVKNPKSQLLVNCPFNQWFDGWIWFERSHSYPNRSHISCQTPSWKNLKPDQKFPKMETGPVTETYQKWKVLILKLTS
ncbi:hypothetical protein KIW84_020252 [Lathyrus oleraceus]|uniref:Uncharacterized protein n=1 Tax=Pisum sativum TaxID=3888 RepID=A0A9D4Y4H9_PEA|nr:hypothetical protein KIW84_020252 [Pisum sativum]